MVEKMNLHDFCCCSKAWPGMALPSGPCKTGVALPSGPNETDDGEQPSDSLSMSEVSSIGSFGSGRQIKSDPVVRPPRRRGELPMLGTRRLQALAGLSCCRAAGLR